MCSAASACSDTAEEPSLSKPGQAADAGLWPDAGETRPTSATDAQVRGEDASARGDGAVRANETPDAAALDASLADATSSGARDATVPPEDTAPPMSPLPMGVRELFPLPDATGLCPDPPLRIGFAGTPTLGTRGKVQVWSEDSPSTPVVTIDLAAGTKAITRGGRSFQQPPPAYVDGNAVVFALPPGALGRGKRYHVTVEEGAVRGPSGPFALEDATSWRFQTAASGPTDSARLAVAMDGRAPFCSVQGAVDAVPANNQTATAIEIGAGSYFGIVHWSAKNKLTLRGSGRDKTRLLGTNNNELNPSTQTRALFSVESSSDIALENLTIQNLTPQGGSQAEALALLGCDRCTLRDSNVLSLQDTLLWNGRVYAENSFIAGNVDFIWGTGSAFFKSCEIKTVGRAGYLVQSRNGAESYGYVFVDSKLTSDPGISGAVLARIDAAVYPASNVAFIDCEMGPHISAAGWTVTNGGSGGSLRFWEYGSKDVSGNPIATSGRSPYSRQLSASEAAMLRDPANVLKGWKP